MSYLNDATDSATSFVLDASLLATVVLLATILVACFLRSASAFARRLVWIGGLSASLMIPGMLAVGPQIPVAISCDDKPRQEAAPTATFDTEAIPTVSSQASGSKVLATRQISTPTLPKEGNTTSAADAQLPTQSNMTLAARERQTRQTHTSTKKLQCPQPTPSPRDRVKSSKSGERGCNRCRRLCSSNWKCCRRRQKTSHGLSRRIPQLRRWHDLIHSRTRLWTLSFNPQRACGCVGLERSTVLQVLLRRRGCDLRWCDGS